MEEWLTNIGLAEHIPAFHQQKITARELVDLTEEDLRELGLTIGERRRFRRALSEAPPVQQPEEHRESGRLGTAESRPLTLLFADLVDSTGLGERLASEDLLEVMRSYRELCGEAITKFGGHIARFLGDGILAYFCYPQANENDPERAVRAALRITQSVRELETPAGFPLGARVGLATGRVLVSDLFAGGSTDTNTIIGSCPNLAARLQALAEPNTIIISDRTYAAISAHFHCEDLGLRLLKGFKEPHRAWKVVEEKTRRTRRLSGTGQPAFVGRDTEREMLRAFWRNTERGQGAAVLVTGEAGMGKSRLVEEFLEEQGLPESAIARIGASPFDENSSLKPFTEYLRTAAGIVSAADPGAFERVRNLLSALDDEQATQIVSALAGVGQPYENPEELPPAQVREAIVEGLANQLSTFGAGGAVCIVVEDLHWFDPSSREVLDRVIEDLPNRRTLMLITCRSDSPARFPAKVHATLRLGRLAPDDVAALIRDLVGSRLLDSVDRLATGILERTDGVPLFIEELTRALMQESRLGTISPASIPASLEESLVARLDRSGPGKEVAQAASVIGRSVRRDVLEQVCGVGSSRLSQALQNLLQIGVFERLRGAPTESYTFHHALLRDAAYASLVRDRRQELHCRVAEALQTLDAESVDLYPETLAQHLSEAGQSEEAAAHWIAAAKRSLARSALQEAASILQRSLRELENLTPRQRILELRLQISALLGPVLIALKGATAAETQRLYTKAYELCQTMPDSPSHFPILWGWWRSSPYAPERAPALLRHAQQANDPELLLEAHHCSWAVNFNQGRFWVCEGHIDAGLEIYASGHYAHHAPLYGNHDAKVCAHGNLSQLRWMQGRLRQAILDEEESVRWAEETRHLGTRVHALGLTLLHRVYRRDFREVHDRAGKLIDLTAEHGMADRGAAGLIFQGWVTALKGDPVSGLQQLEKGLAREREVAANEDLAVYLCLLSEVLCKLGRPEEAVERIECERQKLEEVDLWIWYPELLRSLGDAVLAADPGRLEEAERHYASATAMANGQGAPMIELRVAVSRARALGAKLSVQSVRTALARIPEPDSSSDFVAAQACLEAALTA